MNFLTTIFKKELLVIAGVIGVELFGLYFAISAFCLLMFLSIVDTMLGYYIAHNKQIVSSRIGADGLMKKVVWLFLMAGAVLFLGNMGYTSNNETLLTILSVGVMILIGFRILFEVISLVENLAIISSTSEQQSLTWITNILTRIVGIGQAQIEKKIDKYTANSVLADKQEYVK